MKRDKTLATAACLALATCLAGCGGGEPIDFQAEDQTEPTQTPAVDTPGDIPEDDATPAIIGMDVEINLTDGDGYSYLVTGTIPDPMAITIDVANARPGEANLVAEGSDFPLTITNTTAGRNAPLPYFEQVEIYPLYDTASPACQLNEAGQVFSADNYCRLTLRFGAYQAYDSDAAMAPDEQLTLQFVPYQGEMTHPMDWEGPVDEAAAEATAASVSSPTGWALTQFSLGAGSGRDLSGDQDLRNEFGNTLRISNQEIIWVSPGIYP